MTPPEDLGTPMHAGMVVTVGDTSYATCPCTWQSANVGSSIAAAEQLDRHQRTVCKRFIRP